MQRKCEQWVIVAAVDCDVLDMEAHRFTAQVDIFCNSQLKTGGTRQYQCRSNNNITTTTTTTTNNNNSNGSCSKMFGPGG